MKQLLELLDNIERELKKIGEWPAQRSIDLDWHLPLNEYLQFVMLPKHKELLLKNELPDSNSSLLDMIQLEWIRNPKYEPVTKVICHYFNRLKDLAKSDDSYRPETFTFFKLLTDEDADIGKKHMQNLKKWVDVLRADSNEHTEVLNQISFILENHEKQLSRKEVPAPFEESIALYFSVIDFDLKNVNVSTSMTAYQEWLEANPDNQRTRSNWFPSNEEIEIKVAPADVNKMFESVFSELGKTAKVQGFKMGQAPINELKKSPAIKKRGTDMVRDRLMKTLFEDQVVKPLGKNSFQEVLAEFQPLTRLVENEEFKFRVRYNPALQ
jgi:hypothetical protein